MFFCKTCRRSFSLLLQPGEEPAQYARRLSKISRTACPRCGLVARACKKSRMARRD